MVLFHPLNLFSFHPFLFSISSIFIHPFNPFFVYFIYFYLSILFISIPFHPIYIFRMVKTISTIPNENGQNDQKYPSQTAPKNNKCHIFVHLFCFSVATNGLEICKWSNFLNSEFLVFYFMKVFLFINKIYRINNCCFLNYRKFLL